MRAAHKTAASRADAAPRERTGKPVKRRAEGQWALGYREHEIAEIEGTGGVGRVTKMAAE